MHFVLQPLLQRFGNKIVPFLEMCKYSAPCFCAMINPCTDTLHKREHICTLLSTFISTSHNLLRKNPVTKKKNWPKVWTILNKIKVTPQITSQSISLISSEILIIPKTTISRLAQEQDIFARSHISLPIFTTMTSNTNWCTFEKWVNPGKRILDGHLLVLEERFKLRPREI